MNNMQSKFGNPQAYRVRLSFATYEEESTLPDVAGPIFRVSVSIPPGEDGGEWQNFSDFKTGENARVLALAFPELLASRDAKVFTVMSFDPKLAKVTTNPTSGKTYRNLNYTKYFLELNATNWDRLMSQGPAVGAHPAKGEEVVAGLSQVTIRTISELADSEIGYRYLKETLNPVEGTTLAQSVGTEERARAIFQGFRAYFVAAIMDSARAALSTSGAAAIIKSLGTAYQPNTKVSEILLADTTPIARLVAFERAVQAAQAAPTTAF